MKKYSVFFSILVILLFSVTVFAQTPWPDRSGQAKAPVVSKDAPVSNFVFGLNNLSGDFGLIYESDVNGTLAVGIGLDVLNYKQGLVTLRAQAFLPSGSVLNQENATILGASVLVNLIQLAGQIPGTTWLAKSINPSIGLFMGYDFVSGKPAIGPMISILNIPF